MKLTVLIDNNTIIDRYFQGEPGVSYYIECEGKKYLFDTGYSDLFLENANKMGIDLLELDVIVISHGHNDHTWGLGELVRLYTEAALEGRKLQMPTVIAHPDAFLEKRENGLTIGSMLSVNLLETVFPVSLTKKPVKLADNLIFLGEIPRNTSFESISPVGETLKNGIWQEDFVYDDSALVHMTDRGLIIVTGCSHSGICNIIEYAKIICNDDRICDIIGGFHLLSSNQYQLDKINGYFKSNQIDTIHACHCTDLQSKIRLAQVANIKEVGVGLVIEY